MNSNMQILDKIARLACANSLKTDISDNRITFLLDYQNHQSISFYSDISFVIQKLYPGNNFLEILDVGSRTGAGANFLGQIFSTNSYSRIKSEVTALDISEEFLEYSNSFNRYIKKYIVDDIANVKDIYDLVVCSHTIEHVPNPDEFIKNLCKLSRRHVIIACPFMEGKAIIHKDASGLIEGHVNSIDYDFVDKYKPVYFDIYRSLVWHQSLACIFVIDVSTIG